MSNKQFLFIVFAFFFIFIVCLMYWRPELFDKYIIRFFPTRTAKSMEIKGIGVIGDSLSDEYQADDARGYEWSSTTLNWVEQLVKSRKLNFGIWNQWGDSRRTGFKYNWSRTGATSNDVIVNGQHTGLSQYIANGEVNIVIVYIGGNDFSPFNTTDGYLPIYNGTLARKDIAKKIDSVIVNIETILDTIQQTKTEDGKKSQIKVLLATIPDWNLNPTIFVANRNEAGRRRVSDAIEVTNNKLVQIAKKRKIPLLDVNEFYRQQISHAILGSLRIGTENISLYIPGDEPTRAFLSDTIHPGTVMNGLFANYLFETLNKEFGTNILPLNNDEILRNAGLKVE